MMDVKVYHDTIQEALTDQNAFSRDYEHIRAIILDDIKNRLGSKFADPRHIINDITDIMYMAAEEAYVLGWVKGIRGENISEVESKK